MRTRCNRCFDERKTRVIQCFPTVNGRITWQPLPAHAVLMLPGVGVHVLGETDEMHSLLPSASNSAEATNSVKSRLCGHNARSMHSRRHAWRMALRLHEGLMSCARPLPSQPFLFSNSNLKHVTSGEAEGRHASRGCSCENKRTRKRFRTHVF